MSSDAKRLAAVFVVLVGLIAAPFLIDAVRERRRPVPVAVRVVTATVADPVFSSGDRRLAPGEAVEIALALKVRQLGRGERWLAPVNRLSIDGAEVEHEAVEHWPDADRSLRVFWFTIESSFVGGRLTADNAAERLRYRTYLAPEMGRSLRADRLPDIHNDDHLGATDTEWPEHAGTIRLYARVELVAEADDLQPLHVVSSIEVDRLLAGGVPTILRGFDFGEGVDEAAGELLGLPGFEPEGDSLAERDGVTVAAFGRSFSELVAARIVVSSWTLAAVAATGRADLDPEALADLGELRLADDRLLRGRGTIAWGDAVRGGDLLLADGHWLVLLGDNGDGILDPADPILHCWGRPPERTTVFAALGDDVVRLRHLRFAPDRP